MAQATIPHRSSPRPATRPSADELDRYLATHTVPQAAKRWHVNERTIRKWRARADAPTATVLAQDERTAPTAIDNAPTFPATADDVAGDNTMWRDPWSQELRLVPPGAHRKAWEADRIAAMERHKAAVQAALTPAPIGPSKDTLSSQDDAVTAALVSTDIPDAAPAHDEGLDLDAPFEALQSEESRGPDLRLGSDRVTAWPSAPMVITRIVRLPAETHPRGIYDRLADLQVETIMGPELGAAVAFLLIVLTFWGLG